jgi:pSer/pThr/pTyr-binding forkhead associated (FHA) protein
MQEEKTRLLHAPGPVLVSLDKDRSQDLPLNRDHLIIGKSRSQCDIVLSGDTISRKHARIERRMDGYYVTDLFSTNGTFLDGHRLESGQAVAMKDGAQLTIASTHFRVSIPEQAA